MSLSVSFLVACSQSDIVDDASKILVRVNEEAITQEQLKNNINTLLGKQAATVGLQQAEKKKILESMIVSRLLRQEAEKKLNDKEKLELQIKAAEFKEKLIVNSYLRANLSSASVSNQMIANYYNKHPEKFGAESIIKYELLTSSKKLDELNRDELLNVYSRHNKQTDLEELQKELSKNGFQLSFQRGRLIKGVLDKKIERTIGGLYPGEVSSLILQNGRPYIVKLIESKDVPPKPLSVVSNEIKKLLAPVVLKAAIKEQAAKFKKQAVIEYF